jgi:hypothetical protein
MGRCVHYLGAAGAGHGDGLPRPAAKALRIKPKVDFSFNHVVKVQTAPYGPIALVATHTASASQRSPQTLERRRKGKVGKVGKRSGWNGTFLCSTS